MTVAERSLSSRSAICFSSIACSFFASSYSAFSAMSPNSRAARMRSATSRRRSVDRCSILDLSSSSPSGVRMTSLGMGKGAQHTRGSECQQKDPGIISGCGRAELVIQPLRQLQALSVPRIGLPHPPSRAFHSKMVLGAIDDPIELVDDLLDGWLPVAVTEQPFEDPGVTQRAACQQD